MTEVVFQEAERSTYLTEGGEKCNELRKYFKRRTRIHLSDGRVFIGFLRAVDSTMGVILSDTSEYFYYGDKDRQYKQGIGRVVIPGQHIIRCETLK